MEETAESAEEPEGQEDKTTTGMTLRKSSRLQRRWLPSDTWDIKVKRSSSETKAGKAKIEKETEEEGAESGAVKAGEFDMCQCTGVCQGGCLCAESSGKEEGKEGTGDSAVGGGARKEAEPEAKEPVKEAKEVKVEEGEEVERVTGGSDREEEEDEEDEGSESDDPDRLWCICQQPHNDR